MATTSVLTHNNGIAKVQEWLAHSNISTIRLYERLKAKPKDSPSFRKNTCLFRCLAKDIKLYIQFHAVTDMTVIVLMTFICYVAL